MKKITIGRCAVAGIGLMDLTRLFAQSRKQRVAVVGTGGRGTIRMPPLLLMPWSMVWFWGSISRFYNFSKALEIIQMAGDSVRFKIEGRRVELMK